jgi:hypothetical protein
MTRKQSIGAAGTLATCVAVVLVAMVGSTTRVKAMNDKDGSEDWRIRRGFEIAPVPLNLKGKDLRAVGLGSYLVNAVASCNDCHSAGPQTQYLPGGETPTLGNLRGLIRRPISVAEEISGRWYWILRTSSPAI